MTRDEDEAERLKELPALEVPAQLMDATMQRVRDEARRRPEGLRQLAPVPLPRAALARALLWVRGERVSARARPAWALVGLVTAVAIAVMAATLQVIRERPRSVLMSDSRIVDAKETRIVGAGGQERLARSGEALSAGDVVRTASDGSMAIELASARVQIDADSAVRVQDVTSAQLDLLDGRIEGAGTLSVAVGKETVKLVRGSVGVLRLGGGQVAVAALGHAAEVEIAGRAVVVGTGEVALAREGGAAVLPLPSELTVEILKAEAGGKVGEARLAGKTHPAVLLVVNDRRVEVDPSGRFVASIAVGQDGKVRARARDAAGRSRTIDDEVLPIGTDLRWKR